MPEYNFFLLNMCSGSTSTDFISLDDDDSWSNGNLELGIYLAEMTEFKVSSITDSTDTFRSDTYSSTISSTDSPLMHTPAFSPTTSSLSTYDSYFDIYGNTC